MRDNIFNQGIRSYISCQIGNDHAHAGENNFFADYFNNNMMIFIVDNVFPCIHQIFRNFRDGFFMQLSAIYTAKQHFNLTLQGLFHYLKFFVIQSVIFTRPVLCHCFHNFQDRSLLSEINASADVRHRCPNIHNLSFPHQMLLYAGNGIITDFTRTVYTLNSKIYREDALWGFISTFSE